VTRANVLERAAAREPDQELPVLVRGEALVEAADLLETLAPEHEAEDRDVVVDQEALGIERLRVGTILVHDAVASPGRSSHTRRASRVRDRLAAASERRHERRTWSGSYQSSSSRKATYLPVARRRPTLRAAERSRLFPSAT
jgi:hypothetical protein